MKTQKLSWKLCNDKHCGTFAHNSYPHLQKRYIWFAAVLDYGQQFLVSPAQEIVPRGNTTHGICLVDYSPCLQSDRAVSCEPLPTTLVRLCVIQGTDKVRQTSACLGNWSIQEILSWINCQQRLSASLTVPACLSPCSLQAVHALPPCIPIL